MDAIFGRKDIVKAGKRYNKYVEKQLYKEYRKTRIDKRIIFVSDRREHYRNAFNKYFQCAVLNRSDQQMLSLRRIIYNFVRGDGTRAMKEHIAM